MFFCQEISLLKCFNVICVPLFTFVKKQKSMAENHAFCGLGYPDSNQNKQNQNLLCYHYTIAQA